VIEIYSERNSTGRREIDDELSQLFRARINHVTYVYFYQYGLTLFSVTFYIFAHDLLLLSTRILFVIENKIISLNCFILISATYNCNFSSSN